jgi:hypothetical protein
VRGAERCAGEWYQVVAVRRKMRRDAAMPEEQPQIPYIETLSGKTY